MTEQVRTYIERNISGSWSDISSYVVGDLEIEYLIPDNSDVDKLASVGTLGMTMDNENGLFSPSSVFQRGTPVRVRTVYDDVSKTRFKGTILDVDPDTLEWGDQYVRVTAVDWMYHALNFPMDTPEILADKTIDEAVAYLLSLMDVQPESVVYHEGRETFDFVFDTSRNASNVYGELQKLALSEFAHVYIRAGNILVVESADTRHGLRELTKVPVVKDDLEAILTDPDGGAILVAEGTQFAILADRMRVPNLVSGTHQPMDIELEKTPTMYNVVNARSYPTREDASPVKLFQLDSNIIIPAKSRVVIKATWANPNGGGYINAKDFQPLVTGTNYIFMSLDKSDRTQPGPQDLSTNLIITNRYNSRRHGHNIYNNGQAGILTKLDVYAKGIYPYNPIEAPVGVTGSFSEHGVFEMNVDQKYQDDFTVSERLAETIVEDNKDPTNRLISETFDASSDPELMQASQYMDIGDLTWTRNVKPSVDTYAYIRGKKTVITPAGIVTETWYLKETDTVRKGLRHIALNFAGLGNGIENNCAVNFGNSLTYGNTGKHSWSIEFYMRDGPSTAPLLSMTDVDFSGNSSTDLSMHNLGGADNFLVRRVFAVGDVVNPGVWTSATGTLTGLQNSWHTVTMTHDDSSPLNTPVLYLDGVSLPLTVSDAPEGTATDIGAANLVLGNLNVLGAEYFYSFNGFLRLVRIYKDRILSEQEAITLANNKNNPLVVTEGLSFIGPFVKDEDYSGITGTALYPHNKLIDGVYGLRGTPQWNFPSGTAWALKAYDPNF